MESTEKQIQHNLYFILYLNIEPHQKGNGWLYS